MSEWTTLLSGVVGSQAYGLATPESDVDRLAFAAAPTIAFHGLTPLNGTSASRVTKDPDVTTHEIGKAMGLLLKCNPTVTELLWLNEWEEVHNIGKILVANRTRFLSDSYVKNAYLGYASSQFLKLRRERDESITESRRHKAKNARHLMRLVDQGVQLHTTGQLSVRVADPDALFAFGRRAAEDPGIAANYLSKAHDIIYGTQSALPMKANRDFAEDFLHEVRAHFFIDALEAE